MDLFKMMTAKVKRKDRNECVVHEKNNVKLSFALSLLFFKKKNDGIIET